MRLLCFWWDYGMTRYVHGSSSGQRGCIVYARISVGSVAYIHISLIFTLESGLVCIINMTRNLRTGLIEPF